MNLMNLDEYDLSVLRLVQEHGHAVQGVFPTQEDEGYPFCYTVGRAAIGRPELLIYGPLSLEAMHSILDGAVIADTDTPLEDGQHRDDILRDFPVRIVAVDPEGSEMSMARRLFGEITALQLVYPDALGHFPDDADYALAPDAQRVVKKES